MADYLLPISDREPLAWIVSQQRTAVSRARRREADRLEVGDRIFLYTTRGCFRNPNRDRGRVIGVAQLKAKAHDLERPVVFGGREFHVGLPLRIASLASRENGVELVPLVAQMSSFPNKRAWSAYMRRALVPLTAEDGDLLAREIRAYAHPYAETLQTYEK